MIPPIHREPERDPLIAGALHAVDTGSTDGEDLLVRRIVDAARPQLVAMRRAPRPWWEWTASWARIAVPIGVAASLGAGVLALQAADRWMGEPLAAETALVTESALVLGADDPLAGTELAAELLPRPTDEWLLSEGVDR